jgi:hypothetical protein
MLKEIAVCDFCGKEHNLSEKRLWSNRIDKINIYIKHIEYDSECLDGDVCTSCAIEVTNAIAKKIKELKGRIKKKP